MLKVLQISDLHFGPKHLADKIRCFAEVIDTARAWQADLAAIPGDVYDHTLRLDEEAAQASVRLFSALADICPVLIARGNFTHDRASVQLLRHVRGRCPIHVSTEPEVLWFDGKHFLPQVLPETLENPHHRTGYPKDTQALLCTLPYPSSAFLARTQTRSPQQLQDALSQALSQILIGFTAIPSPPDLPRILLFHGTVRGAQITATQHVMGLDVEVALHDIERGGFHLACCGHLHYPQRLGTMVFYAGGLTHDTFGEEGEKGAWLHMIAGPDVHAEFHPVSSVPRRLFEVTLSDAVPFLTPPAWSEEVCDVKVRVTVPEAHLASVNMLDFPALFPNARDVQVERIIIPVTAVRCEAVRQAQSLPAKIQAYLEYAGHAVSPSLLDKATLLADAEDNAEALIEQVKTGLTSSRAHHP